jgi:hypothetical protein
MELRVFSIPDRPAERWRATTARHTTLARDGPYPACSNHAMAGRPPRSNPLGVVPQRYPRIAVLPVCACKLLIVWYAR